MTAIDEIRTRYLEVNGEHPMTAGDEEYCRRLFAPLASTPDHPLDELVDLVLRRRLPLPSYLLTDGTVMVHHGYVDNLRAAGGPDRIEAWFKAHWADEQTAGDEWESYLSGQYVCLYRVTPDTIKAKTRLIDEIVGLAARVDDSPADDALRTGLRAVVDDLDQLEPPFTEYDRLRFGGPLSRDVWIDGIREKYLGDGQPASR